MKLLLAALLTTATAAPAVAAGDEAPGIAGRADGRVDRRADRLRIQQMNRQAAAGFARRDQAMARDNRQSAERYAAERARYERAMAEWRRQVAACNAGDYAACER